MMQCDVLIIGAGPTGLVLALWLTKLGVRVRILDKLAEPGTTSRALAVQARTLELYRQVGLAAAVVEGGVQVPDGSRYLLYLGTGSGGVAMAAHDVLAHRDESDLRTVRDRPRAVHGDASRDARPVR